MTKRWVTLLTLVLISGLPQAFSAPSRVLTGRDLPILRDHFQRKYIETFIALRISSGRAYLTPAEMKTMDRRVSEQIDQFLLDLAKRLGTLEAEYRAGRRNRERALDPATTTEERMAAQFEWRRSLAAIEDQAGEIRSMLGPVLRGLKSKNKFKPEISEDSEGFGFQQEMNFLGEHIGKVAVRIRNFFFTPNHVVSLEALRGESMMVCLHHVQKMSEGVRKRIRLG